MARRSRFEGYVNAMKGQAEKPALSIKEKISAMKEKAKTQEHELPDVVVSLLGSASGELADDDLNGRKAYHQYIEEKYK